MGWSTARANLNLGILIWHQRLYLISKIKELMIKAMDLVEPVKKAMLDNLSIMVKVCMHLLA